MRVKDDYNGTSQRPGVSSPRYSRSEGITSYRRRRRFSRVTKTITALILIAIIGGAGFLFGRQYVDELSGAFATQQPAATETPEVEAEPTPALQPVEISIVMAGDIVMGNSVVESGRTETGSYDFSHLFAQLSEEINRFDVRMVSQETSMGGSKFGFGYTIPLNAPQDLGRSEVAAGFNTILHASDHASDTGFEGMHNELSWWRSEQPNIPVLGIAEPDPEAYPHLSDYVHNVYLYQKEGFTIAVLNHSWGIPEEEQGVVSVLDEQKIGEDVRKAKDMGADMIIACPHWGEENNAEVHEEEHEFAKVYAGLGVDVIIGTHPRVLQPVEVLEGANGHKTLCFYSLGCLISSLNNSANLIGGLAEVKLQRDSTGACSITSAVLKPVVTHRGSGEDFATYLLSDYTDELAWSSWDAGLTPESVSQTCKDVLGDAYNEETDELVVAL